MDKWFFAALLAAIPAVAPGAPVDTRVSGTAAGNNGTARFVCFGMPTCSGTVTVLISRAGCSNTFTFTSDFTLTGFDLSHPGSPSGTFTLATYQSGATPHPDGTCTYQTASNQTAAYSATWNGVSGTIAIDANNDSGQPRPITGAFTASLPASSPVFPMTVDGSFTSTATDVNATIQPRSQDVGTSASIFVFAHAPSNLVRGAAASKRVGPLPPIASVPEDAAVVCVLAQVDSSGQLVAVSASTMQAYLTGVLTSQSQAVNILNNVATPNVAGATMYIGYGTNATSMFSGGVYQSAISVPGAVQCTASLASAPAPESPGALTGLWWNPNESGWGIHFTQRGSNVFAAWYTYDGAGNPKWYVSPQCVGATGSSGTCSGTLYEVNGPRFFGVDFTPTTPSEVTTAGSLTVNFQNANNASMSYTVGSRSRTIAIVRQIFLVAATSPPAVDYTDLWWNPNESGWGMAITQQFGNIFLAWYVYDSSGKPFWYVAPSCAVSGSSCLGTLYRTTGPPFGPPLDPTKVQPFAVGSAIVSFVDANNAVLSYTVDGVSATKVIQRQLF